MVRRASARLQIGVGASRAGEKGNPSRQRSGQRRQGAAGQGIRGPGLPFSDPLFKMSRHFPLILTVHPHGGDSSACGKDGGRAKGLAHGKPRQKQA
jgi:hypothetical protein